jgi:hypothetical protein
MIGFVAENLPNTGAVGLNFMGGAGMFAVSLYLMFMGGYYDRLLSSKLPGGNELKSYIEAAPGSDMAMALNEAKKAAGPEIINVTLVIPIVLIVAFGALFLYMRSKSKNMATA